MAFFIKFFVNYFIFIGFVSHAEYCQYDNNSNFLDCNNFDSFDELNDYFINIKDKIKKFRLSPKKLTQLEKDSVVLRPVEDLFEEDYDVILENIDGFEFDSNPFDRIKAKGRKLELNNIQLSFFDKQNKDISQNCSLDIFLSDLQLPFFSQFKIVHLNQNISYKYSICPVLFKRSITEKLIVSDASSKFRFSNLKAPTKNRTLQSSSIFEYELLNLDVTVLNENLLTEELFKNLVKFKLTQSNASDSLKIPTNYFKNFKKINEFYLSINNFESFFKSSFEWISNLNNDINNQFKLVFKDNNQIPYEYSDDDFCIFSEFPHDKNIFPIIKYKENSNQKNCSCTLLWLNRNFTFFSDQTIYSEEDSAISGCLENFDEFYQNCNMSSRIDFCNSLKTTLPSTTPSKTTTTTAKSTATTTFPFGFVVVSKNPPKQDNTNTIIFIIVGIIGAILFSILFGIYILRIRKRSSIKENMIKLHYSKDDVNIY
jgi:hypothetical protein